MHSLWYLIPLLPPLLGAFLVQTNIMYNFKRYSKRYSVCGVKAENAVYSLLAKDGISGINVGLVSGELTDCYDYKEHTIRLSGEVFGSTSISAVASAVYLETLTEKAINGNKSLLTRLRYYDIIGLSALVMMFIMLIGIITGLTSLIWISMIIVYGFFLFHIINVKMEKPFLASALKKLEDNGFLAKEEMPAAKNICSALQFRFIGSVFIQFMKLADKINKTRIISGKKNNK